MRGQTQQQHLSSSSTDNNSTRDLLSSFRLYNTIRSEDVASEIYYPDANGMTQVGSVPTELSGLFWMDGNDLSEYIASLGQSHWESVQDDGYECQMGTVLTPYSDSNNDSYDCLGGLVIRIARDARTWSYSGSLRGQLYTLLVRIIDARVYVECGAGRDGSTIEYCQLRFQLNWWGLLFDLIFQLAQARFEMTYAGNGLWYRDSYYGESTEGNRYWFKRIINGDGTVNEPYWTEYLSGGTATPSAAERDNRETVSFVPDTQVVLVQ